MGRPAEQLEHRVQIGQLKNHHRSMARDIIAMGEVRNVDLARIYSMTQSQISIIVNSPVFQAELARLETEVEESVCDVREGIRLLVPRAEQVLKEELYKDNDELAPMGLRERKMRLEVAFNVLDRDSGKKKHGESAAADIHFHQHNELHVKGMSTEQLRNNIFDILEKS